MFLVFIFNSRVTRRRLSTQKAVSRRNFKFLTEERIAELKKIKLKKRSESKVKWAVNAFNDWRQARLGVGEIDETILNTDLSDFENLTQEKLEYCLVRFIPEVTKSKGEGEYPGKTLYQMVVALQKYLEINKLRWKLIHGDGFQDLRIVLDNVMKQRCASNVGNSKKQAELISYKHEEKMWQTGILGKDNPDKRHSFVSHMY